MKEIPLTQGKIALIDDDDLERVLQHSWCMHPQGYAKARIDTKYVLMHRWIMGAKDGQEIDHVNGNKLDNRKINLRFCTASQNLANRKKGSCGSGQYKGVAWNRYHRKFRARIMLNRKETFLGYYDDQIVAAKAYDTAAKELFGEFACLNFPVEAISC